MNSLSNQQKLFCQKYLELGMNGTQAYLNVYKNVKKESTAMANASRLLRNAKVKEYIEELQSKVEKKAIVSIEEIVNELVIIAFTDRTKLSKSITEEIDIPEQNRKLRLPDIVLTDTDKLTEKEKKVIAGYKKTKNGMTVETYDKMKAIELLGKYLGMWNDTNINNNININYEDTLKKAMSESEY